MLGSGADGAGGWMVSGGGGFGLWCRCRPGLGCIGGLIGRWTPEDPGGGAGIWRW